MRLLGAHVLGEQATEIVHVALMALLMDLRITGYAFMLIADIDSPHHGIIRVKPLNLISLAESLRPH
jgi:hypothetical protein